jgi:PPOX class probable F420-dependent enzyme
VQTADLRERFAAGPVAYLSTVRPDGGPHVVPCVFALVGDTVYSAVDAKPKRTTRLQRLANLRADPRCALLVAAYADDWSRLWWVRADGRAAIVEDPSPDHPGILALIARFPQYRAQPPTGPLLVVTVDHWSGWAASA